MLYYIIDGGVRKGPMEREELPLNGLSHNSMVWREGMADWQPAAMLPELSDLLEDSAFGAYAQAQPEVHYFAMINNVQTGPMLIDELIAAGLKGDTMVWRDGMADWAPASSCPDIAERLASASATGKTTGYPSGTTPEPPVYGASNPYYGNNAYQKGYDSGRMNPHPQPHYTQPDPNMYNPSGNGSAPTNWLPWAIVGTIAGFLCSCVGGIFGIIGIVKASSANDCYRLGNYMMGDQNNSTAKIMTIISLVLAALGLIGNVVWLALLPSMNVLMSI